MSYSFALHIHTFNNTHQISTDKSMSVEHLVKGIRRFAHREVDLKDAELLEQLKSQRLFVKGRFGRHIKPRLTKCRGRVEATEHSSASSYKVAAAPYRRLRELTGRRTSSVNTQRLFGPPSHPKVSTPRYPWILYRRH